MARASATGTAPVVGQLLAFLREPARYRPRFTIGREPIEGGHHVLRFAYGKLPDLEGTGATREELHEAAMAFVRQVCLWEGATHYQVLCLPQDAPRGAVKANYRLLMALIHPDRPEATHGPWPADAAQRANRAYEVLSDEARRREYDAGLARRRESDAAHVPEGAARAVRVVPGRRWPRRLAYALPAVGLVIAALLGFQLWQGDELHQSMLVRGWSAARNKALVASAERPRYLGSAPAGREAPASDADTAEKGPVEIPILAPLLRSLRPRAQPAVETVRPGEMREEVAPERMPPAVVATAAEQAPAAPEPVVVPAKPAAVPAAKPAPPARIETAVAAAPQLAQAASPAPAVTPQDMETVVVHLIDSYEAGQADALMALMDPSNGFWDTMRTREAFSDFFRATKSRHLRITSLDWQMQDRAAHARGMALVQAEYYAEPGTTERKVDLEMDVAMRDGKARITRLTLFPNGP